MSWAMASSYPCDIFYSSASSDLNTKASSLSSVFTIYTSSPSSGGESSKIFTGSASAKTCPTFFSSEDLYRDATSWATPLYVSPFKCAASFQIYILHITLEYFLEKKIITRIGRKWFWVNWIKNKRSNYLYTKTINKFH